MIRYTLYQNNRKNSTTRGQWYARTKVMGITNLETLAARIQRNCTAKKSDVLAVLTQPWTTELICQALWDQIPQVLQIQ